MRNAARYEHTQDGPLYLLICAMASVFLVTAWSFRQQRELAWFMAAAGAMMVLLGGAFRTLSVRDLGDRLLIAFGPIPLFWRTIAYADMARVERTRTSFLDGWGIHLSLRRGWVWNLWGRDAVLIHRRKGKLCIGTDEPEALLQFLQGRLNESA
jgi:hypothetical protein